LPIALVDDSDVHRSTVRHILAHDGYGVAEFESGVAFLDALEEEAQSGVLNSRYDVVLLDYDMPGLDGLSVLDRLRKIDPACSVPVIMMTAHAEEVGVARALSSGACDYIAKPARLTELKARVHTATALKRERDRARAQAYELSCLKPDDDEPVADLVCSIVVEGASRMRDGEILRIAADLAPDYRIVLAPCGPRTLMAAGEGEWLVDGFAEALAAALPELKVRVEPQN